MNVATLIAVDRHFASSSTDDGSFTRFDLSHLLDITLREPVLVLFGDVDVLLQIFGSCAELDAGRIVQPGPLVLPALDQLVEDDAGNGTVGHPVSGIAGGDVDVLITARILS